MQASNFLGAPVDNLHVPANSRRRLGSKPLFGSVDVLVAGLRPRRWGWGSAPAGRLVARGSRMCRFAPVGLAAVSVGAGCAPGEYHGWGPPGACPERTSHADLRNNAECAVGQRAMARRREMAPLSPSAHISPVLETQLLLRDRPQQGLPSCDWFESVQCRGNLEGPQAMKPSTMNCRQWTLKRRTRRGTTGWAGRRRTPRPRR